MARALGKELLDQVYIVIAAYNEEDRLGKVIDGLRTRGYKNIVVVDDGSKDDTAGTAVKHGATLLKHPINRGQGASLQTGMSYAFSKGAKYIVHFDADGQHDADEIPGMLKPILKGKVDVTLGSRFKGRQVNIPFSRKLMLKIAIVVNYFLYGVLLSDAHNGFRAMNRRAASMIRIRADRADHASEIVDLLKQNKLRFAEVPVTIKYSQDTLRRGQTSLTNSMLVGLRLLFRKLMK